MDPQQAVGPLRFHEEAFEGLSSVYVGERGWSYISRHLEFPPSSPKLGHSSGSNDTDGNGEGNGNGNGNCDGNGSYPQRPFSTPDCPNPERPRSPQVVRAHVS